MSWNPITGTAIQYMRTAGGVSASDYFVKFYAADSSTPISMATDSTGDTLLSKARLNSEGYVRTEASEDSIFIPHIDQDYKIALYSSEADADNDDNAAWVIDGLTTAAQEASDVLVTGTNINFKTVAEMISNTGLVLDQFVSVEDYASGHNSGVLFFKVVASGTGAADGGSYIDLPNTTPPLQAKQNFPEIITDRMFGSAPNTVKVNSTSEFQAALDYCGELGKDVHFSGAVTTSSLHPKKYGGIIGQGWFQSVLQLASGTNDHHVILDQSDNRWNTFARFSMDGDKDNQTSLSSSGIYAVRESGSGFTSGGEYKLIDLWVKNYNGDGIELGGFSGATEIRGVDCNYNYGNGYSSFAGDIVISDSEFHNNTLRGINESGVGFCYSNVKCWFNGDNGGDESTGDYGGIGVSDGAVSATVMTDSTQALLINMYVGKTIQNTTDGSTATVASNTETTITSSTLSGGSTNQWNDGDEWFIAETVVRLAGFGFRGGASPSHERRGTVSSCIAQENYGHGVDDDSAGIDGQIVVDGNSITYSAGEVRRSTSNMYDGFYAEGTLNSSWTIHASVFQQTLTPFNTRRNQRYGVNIGASVDNSNFIISTLNHDDGSALNYPAAVPAKNNTIQLDGRLMTNIEQTITDSSLTATPYGITRLNATTSFTQASLGLGLTAPVGTVKTFICDDASNICQISVNDAIGGPYILPVPAGNDGAEVVFRMDGKSKWVPIIINNLVPSNTAISGGVITIYNWNTNLSNEASAASDDLDTINGGWEGMPFVILKPRYDTESVVVKDGTGNLKLNGDFTMDGIDDMIMLQYRNGEFYEVSRSDNSA